jgi:hypothetical protein
MTSPNGQIFLAIVVGGPELGKRCGMWRLIVAIITAAVAVAIGSAVALS